MANASLQDLFGTNLLMHYMADGTSKLFTDTGGTAAAADGNTIKCWKPESDAQYQVNVTEATNGPTYRSNYSATGYAAIEFDGTNDVLSNSAAGFSSGQRAHVLLAMTPIGATSNTMWHRGSSSSQYYRGQASTGAIAAQGANGGGAVSVSTTTNVTNAKKVIAWAFHSNANEINQYGPSVGNTVQIAGASTSGWFVLGAFNTGTPNFSQFGNFAMHEIVVCHANVEWGDVLKGATILRNKWGISDDNAIHQKQAKIRRMGSMAGGMAS